MSADFIKQYAASFPELKDGLAAAGTDLIKILDLVTPDKYNFGSGAWYYHTICDTATKEALRQGTEAGWAAYSKCVGVPADDEGRVAYWNTAKKAFGLA